MASSSLTDVRRVAVSVAVLRIVEERVGRVAVGLVGVAISNAFVDKTEDEKD